MLKKVNETFYCFFDKATGMNFYLKKGRIGVCSRGECWRLFYVHQGSEIFVACFVTRDDYNECYRECIGGKIWCESDIVESANGMIAKIIE